MTSTERQSSRPTLSRFEIVRRLGDGGMGVVYEANDREQGGRVALKTLHRFDAETLLYLKQEFRALQDVQHPNLVRLGELMREGDTWFFTMELVDGTDLFAYLGAAPTRRRDRTEDVTLPRTPVRTQPGGGGGSLVSSSSGERPVPQLEAVDEDKLRAAFAQLAEALGALHAAGKVHRDVKPSNVLVTREGRVVLVDFGLILDSAAPQHDRAVVGTAKYMAPEQAASQKVGPAADLYSYGVVLYQCITGRWPFEGDAIRVIERKLIEDAPRASLVAPHVPRDLDELCARLLDRDPGKRPAAQEIAQRLRGARGPSAKKHQPRAPFVGRDAELSTLHAAFERVSRGDTVAMVVLGESGMGKTALARRFLRDAASLDGVLVLSGRCYEREVVPYKALDGVMDALCQHLAPLEDADVARLFPANAALLTQAFPVLRRLARFEVAARQRRSRADLAAHESRARFFETARDLFVKLGETHTLVVFVDDLHWADADSLALLAEILRPPSPPRMLLVATSRPRDGADAKPLPFAAETLSLPRLGDEHALALARALLGHDRAGAAEAIAAEAHGHPLFVDELVRHAVELGEHAPATSRLDDALSLRVARLEPQARELLEVLSVGGVALARKTAMRASGLDHDAFAHASAVLRAGHLARTAHARGDDQGLEPYHDRVREAVAARIDPSVRRGRHLALANALEPLEGRDPDALATHFLEAGERARAAPYAREAAHKAFEALAYDRAAALFARAIDLGAVDDGELSRLHERHADALASAGRGREAAPAFLRAAEGRGGEQALELRRRSAEELLIAGQLDEGMTALRDVLGRIGVGMPRHPVVTVLFLLYHRAVLALRGRGARIRREEDLPRQALLRMDACWTVARALAFIDPLLTMYFQTRLLRMALRWGEPFRLAYSLGLEGGWIATRGVHTRAQAEKTFERAWEVAKSSDRPGLDALLRASRGFAALVQGRLAEAVSESDAALSMLSVEAPGHFWEMRAVSNIALWALSASGELAELGNRALPALREAEDRGDVTTATMLKTGNLTWLWLRDDDPASGRAAAEEATRQWTRFAFHHQHWWATVALSQIDMYEGKGADAWGRVARDWPRARRALLFSIELVHFDARHVHARAAILAAQAAPPGSAERELLLGHAEADVRWIARRGPAYGAPWVPHLSGCIAAVRGDLEAARRALAEAIPGFDAIPVPLWAASARWQLARLSTGADADALREAARAFFEANGVADPDRLSRVFAPGVSALPGGAGDDRRNLSAPDGN